MSSLPSWCSQDAQLFRERLSEKNLHATIRKDNIKVSPDGEGNSGVDIYTKTRSVEVHKAILRKVVGKMCTRQSRKVKWDMINILFLILQMSNLLFLLSLSTRRSMSMVPLVLLSNFVEGERNNCVSKIQLVGQKYQDKTTLASKTRFSRHCFGFQSRRFSLLVAYNI